MTDLGLALGGGGARGLAHIAILEALDDLGLRAASVAGTSMGAVIGALYAAGASGRDIRSMVETTVASGNLKPLDFALPEWLDFLELDWKPGGMLRADKFLAALIGEIGAQDFSGLDISLAVIAADFWRREEVIFTEGPLEPAIRASMALPGIFRPVEQDGRVLVDGGTVNPVPYDRVSEDCDIVIAVNVMGTRQAPGDGIPNLADSIFNTFQIMQRSILGEKLKHNPPDILVEPDLLDVRVLEFWKADEILRQSASIKETLKRDLEQELDQLERLKTSADS